jgi:hypothetical protein
MEAEEEESDDRNLLVSAVHLVEPTEGWFEEAGSCGEEQSNGKQDDRSRADHLAQHLAGVLGSAVISRSEKGPSCDVDHGKDPYQCWAT